MLKLEKYLVSLYQNNCIQQTCLHAKNSQVEACGCSPHTLYSHQLTKICLSWIVKALEFPRVITCEA